MYQIWDKNFKSIWFLKTATRRTPPGKIIDLTISYHSRGRKRVQQASKYHNEIWVLHKGNMLTKKPGYDLTSNHLSSTSGMSA